MEKTREICSTTGFYSSHLSSNKIQRTHINLSFTFLFIYARYRLVVFMAVVLFHSFILLQHILWSESFFSRCCCCCCCCVEIKNAKILFVFFRWSEIYEKNIL